MTWATDQLSKDIACLNARGMLFTLISTLGFHCDVWRSIGRIVSAENSTPLDFVLKIGKRRCEEPEVRVLGKEYRMLRSALGDIVPDALFVATEINGKPGAVVMAQTCSPWFDLANPTNEAEALPLLRRQPRSRHQLEHFVRCARNWLDEKRMAIDLVGGENLVLDKTAGVRYLDSFHVFFYLDMLDVIDQADDGFLFRVEQAVQRLEYLEWLAGKAAR